MFPISVSSFLARIMFAQKAIELSRLPPVEKDWFFAFLVDVEFCTIEPLFKRSQHSNKSGNVPVDEGNESSFSSSLRDSVSCFSSLHTLTLP